MIIIKNLEILRLIKVRQNNRKIIIIIVNNLLVSNV